jgi:hypothetical protein
MLKRVKGAWNEMTEISRKESHFTVHRGGIIGTLAADCANHLEMSSAGALGKDVIHLGRSCLVGKICFV